MLFGITPDALEHTLLPIGGFEKHEVRAIAEDLKLPVFNKPDSQEICFVPNNDYAGFVERRTPGGFRAGEFVDAAGEVVGAHAGHQHFTIGQRKGLGVALGYPIYVADIDPSSNRVTLAGKDALLKRSLIARQLNLLDPSLRGAPAPVACTAKIRYNHDPQPATVRVTGDDELTVRFDEPQSAITPGRRSCCTTETACWAAAGSIRQTESEPRRHEDTKRSPNVRAPASCLRDFVV